MQQRQPMPKDIPIMTSHLIGLSLRHWQDLLVRYPVLQFMNM